MKRIVALVGIRGAGKSTLLASLNRHPNIKVLKPTTNRPKRSASEEYEFAEPFPHGNSMAWKIEVGEYSYGVRNSEVNSIPDGFCGVTVFYPGSLDVLREFCRKWPGEVVTIGLDTIRTLDEQHERVGTDALRQMSPTEFESQLEQVRNADILVRGDATTVLNATTAACEILISRGGLVGKNWLVPLIRAGALLDNAQVDAVQPASYDLRLGGEVWCQGKRHDLTEQQPFFEIPPYSYAIVKAEESARIPCFMAGRFDLTVSLFFKGVLLSNGPQVDPGYNGALFCTLFNGRDAHAKLKRGKHFATIEFCALGCRVDGYIGHYQGKQNLNDFLIAETGLGPGGDIIGRIDKLDERLLAVRADTAKYWLAMVGTFVGVLTIALTVEMFLLSSLKNDFEKRLDRMVLDAEGAIEAKLDGLSQSTNEARARVSGKIQNVNEVAARSDGLSEHLDSVEKHSDSFEERVSGSAGKSLNESDDESSMPRDPPNGL